MTVSVEVWGLGGQGIDDCESRGLGTRGHGGLMTVSVEVWGLGVDDRECRSLGTRRPQV